MDKGPARVIDLIASVAWTPCSTLALLVEFTSFSPAADPRPPDDALARLCRWLC